MRFFSTLPHKILNYWYLAVCRSIHCHCL